MQVLHIEEYELTANSLGTQIEAHGWVHFEGTQLTVDSQDELTGDQLTVSSLRPVHGELIGMISRIADSKLTM